MIRRCLDISNITPANIRNVHSVAVVGKDTPPPPTPAPFQFKFILYVPTITDLLFCKQQDQILLTESSPASPTKHLCGILSVSLFSLFPFQRFRELPTKRLYASIKSLVNVVTKTQLFNSRKVSALDGCYFFSQKSVWCFPIINKFFALVLELNVGVKLLTSASQSYSTHRLFRLNLGMSYYTLAWAFADIGGDIYINFILASLTGIPMHALAIVLLDRLVSSKMFQITGSSRITA